MPHHSAILLVAPYDRYASIQRFVACLERELSGVAPIRVFQPRPVLARFSGGAARKWSAYVDKFLIAPKQIASAMRGAGLVHLTDHSLAIYTRSLRGTPHLINCHDLIAVRAGLGELPEFHPVFSGRCLQRLILRGLKAARHVVCLADSARSDLLRLTGISPARASVIPMGLHSIFQKIPDDEAWRVTRRFIPDAPFLLHVGGNQWYKNRAGLLAIYAELARTCELCPNLVLLGEPLTSPLKKFIRDRRLAARVFALSDVPDAELPAFYSHARALFFPSLYEGFGWPIIEAQACECPVITTDRDPMNAIAGRRAVLLPPNDLDAAVRSVRDFLNEPPQATAIRVSAAHENASRFSKARMIDAYLSLYSELSEWPVPSPLREPAFA